MQKKKCHETSIKMDILTSGTMEQKLENIICMVLTTKHTQWLHGLVPNYDSVYH
jgi:hypothetical protein